MYEALRKLSKHYDKLKNKILKYQYRCDTNELHRVIVVDVENLETSILEYEDGEWKFLE